LIHIYTQKIDAVWFAIAIDDKLTVWSSSLADNPELAIRRILAHLPIEVEFTSEKSVKNEEIANEVLQALSTLFSGQNFKRKFNLALDHLPSFTRLVLKATSAIPRGYVTTYSEIAKALEKGRGARAVGNAEASNPLPLLIPCHRVVRANGEIGGYGLGTTVKREILTREAESTTQKLEPKTMYIRGKPIRLVPTLTVLEKTRLEF
jgi:methylated-DNA-[protein]-cysteine S-methyltransferase